MAAQPSDPYAVLGVSRQATVQEIRGAYRRAVQREHPDHNGGSPEAARRFEAVQEAYALIRVQRARSAGSAPRPSAENGPPRESGTSADPDLDARLARLEQELGQVRARREQARRAARKAEADATRERDARRSSDEELGYYRTEDSFSQILADAASGLLSEAREWRYPERLADLLDEVSDKLSPRPSDPPRD